MKIYSAWGVKEEKEANRLIEGHGPPRFANGEIDVSSPDLFFIFQACTFEEAMAIYYLRQGWGPYTPIGEPAECPECGSAYYPKDSGQCWKCDCNS